jgi:two-component system, OmpR family, phosphate regulon sensor histidine kinase PhoR
MQKKNTVFLLGITSIIILITVQILIVVGVWRQKDEMFNLRYNLLSKEALAQMERRGFSDGFDTARYLISGYSAKVIREGLTNIKDDSLLKAKKKEILQYVNKVLLLEQDLSPYLSSYFERRGFEKNFKFDIVINRLEIINFDTRIPIYESPDFRNRRPPNPPNIIPSAKKGSSRILVNGYRAEDNNYQIFFEYYIDFSDKQAVILKEVSTSLKLSIFSILFVVIIFMITYRNLLEEKRLSNLKTDFINNMTHELKTPLSTITVAGKTLEMERIRKDDAKIMETAKLIGKQSVHLNQLINMILEISMWERTQFQLDKKNVDLEEIMNDIIESFRSGCSNGAVINMKYNFKGLKAEIDLVYFTTMINNLLSNAVKYSDKTPVIDIEGFTENNNICIKVADNGIGITKTDQKHVFDKFYRAATGNIHKYKGLGLGLYYVKKIAMAHGGDVSVTSKPGKGSIFTVTLPY